MAIMLQLPLCMYELQGSMAHVDDHFLPHNVILPLTACRHNGMHFFVVSGHFQTVSESVSLWYAIGCPC